MEASSRREYLAQMVETAETDAVRLKALDLLDRLDEREGKALPSSEELTEAAAERLADDPAKLGALIDLAILHNFFDRFPAFRGHVDRRAETLVGERALAARQAFHVAGSADGPSEPPEVVSGPENAAELHPVDRAQMALSAHDEERHISVLRGGRRFKP